MRMLKKHQAFEAEIVANTDRIKNIKQVRNFLCLHLSLQSDSIQEHTGTRHTNSSFNLGDGFHVLGDD